ncbi:MAG: protein jag [Chloroflexi bacterium]|nr:protein jag [Chloroflexota bacterium]
MRNKLERVEISARTVDEAIEVALKELDAEREEVTIEVVSQGRAGIFGIGAEQARVRVTRLAPSNTLASEAIEVVTKLLAAMEVSATAILRTPGDAENGPTIDIQGDDSGLLIGKRGETLQSMQFLVNLMLGKKGIHPLVVLDVEEYKERRSRSLQAMAARVAERVASNGRPISLEPMPPAERRIIHVALSNHPSVTTESVGAGAMRKVTVYPKRERRTQGGP